MKEKEKRNMDNFSDEIMNLEKNELIEEKKKKEIELQQSNEINNELTQQCESLGSSMVLAEQENIKLKQKIQTLESKNLELTTSSSSIEELQHQMSILKSTINENKLEKSKLNETINNLEREIFENANLQGNFFKLQVESLSKENQRLHQRNLSYIDENHSLLQKIDSNDEIVRKNQFLQFKIDHFEKEKFTVAQQSFILSPKSSSNLFDDSNLGFSKIFTPN
ncbi:hypothetical protein BpHYR1_021269 [Brachionus plicatilis]|uniref:Uncharacterized protein n=1 Tax=Brachionus plicatilis TaxID=10195 RepID=A0A3M7QRD5_BRAPC|nr:hypothetical protein BpHYR1_021269 [Brachionus plicatilis]